MALFHEVSTLAERLAGEGSRLKKRAAVAEQVARLAGQSGVAPPSAAAPEANNLVQAGRFCLYLAGQPFPEADSRRLNAGGAILSKALKAVSGASDAAMTAAYRRHGDLGAAAFDLLAPPYGRAPGISTLTLDDVAATFEVMASARTTQSRSESVELLLRQSTALEAKYLLKLMLGDMRIGVKQSLIEEAIAVAAGVAVEAVRHAVMLEADLQRVVARAFAGTLEAAHLRLFHPLGFMLASPVETPAEAVERFTEKAPKPPKPLKTGRKREASGTEAVSTAEKSKADGLPGMTIFDVLPSDTAGADYAEDIAAAAADASSPPEETPPGIHAFLEDKFDGIRAQVHCGDPTEPGRVTVYSRSREDITESFPEIAEAFASVMPATGGLVFDGEILGWDLAGDRALPFAVLGQRIGRKRVSNDLRRSIPVVFMAFDLMYAGGELLLPRPLRERRERLESLVAELQPQTFAPLDAGRQAELQGSLFGGGELDDAGNPAISGLQRLRLSRAQPVESAEAVDQGYRDARARSNEGVMLKAAGSAYLPGRRGLAWLKLKRELATLDVVITGAEYGSGKRAQLLSDYTFAVRGPDGALTNLGKAYQGVTDAEIAELTEWLKAHTLEDFGHFRTVEPVRVIEVAFNNIMRSDRHASGFALRFPRILRLRPDKPLTEIDTLARVEEVYASQPDKPEETGDSQD